MTAAEDNMKSKLPGTHNTKHITQVFDSVTAAEDNMKSKLPGAQNKPNQIERPQRALKILP